MTHIYSTNKLTYSINNKIIINKISCKISAGLVTKISGPNGAGKTTFLKLLYGLYVPSLGYISRNFDPGETKLSYVFQNSVFLNRTVEDNLKHVLYCKNINKLMWTSMIKKLLNLHDLNYMLNLHVNLLSGGELQLLALMRSILINPDILFYDEPTNNLDKKNISIITNMIKKLNRNGTSIILVSHDNIFCNDLDYTELTIDKGKLV